jgi:DNA-binding transcriptional LysR family regulator
MNLKQIDYILELARTENFNRAAENLFVSQPTLTYQVKSIENEVGFQIFDRSEKGTSITPAGAQFIVALQNLRNQLTQAIEQGQNFSSKYTDDIVVGLPLRSALYFLPEAMIRLQEQFPTVSVTPKFSIFNDMNAFLRKEQDVLFGLREDFQSIPNINIHPLFTSHIYLISQKEDPLAKLTVIKPTDIEKHTLMIGGGSSPALRKLQQDVIRQSHIDYFNSQDHETTLINVAAGKGICLAPGFLNDHNGEFVWTPFETDVVFDCVIATHKTDQRVGVHQLIKNLQNIYVENVNVPL